MQKRDIFLNISKGVAVVLILWAVNTFIAFVIFSVESNTILIILIWLIVDIILIFILYRIKYFNTTVTIFAFIFIGILVSAYFLPINSNIPQDAIKLNNSLSQENENKYDYAMDLFFSIEDKYTSPIRQYLLEPWKVFVIKDFEYFWNLERGEYADSNIQGRIYRKLLLESQRFSAEEVLIHQSFCSNSPHVLVRISHPEREDIWVDFWAVDNFPGVESDETYQFGMRTIRPCDKLTGVGYIP